MDTRELTFGEKLVGLTFNPSGDETVNRVKTICAELADILDAKRTDSVQNGTYNNLRQLIIENSFSEVLNAQMNIVKAITLF